jgi:nicotinate-nucleotide--dimethylbenzimidazole phosphoribosyltransferase
MTREEAFRAVGTGLALAERWTSGPDGFRVIALGEMGIGNTTAASALISAQLGIPAFRVVGPGTGLDERGVAHKRQVVATAVQLHHDGQLDPWDLLARLGGFEILGLAGLAIGAARARTLIVLDGLISTVAALIADKLCPGVRGSLLAAHVGAEPGHRVVLDHLGMSPLFDLDLRLGEGTGAALALPWVASAADLLRDMATFDDAGVSGRIAPGQSSA